MGWVLLVMLMLTSHCLRVILGEAMGRVVPSLVKHPMRLTRMLQRMPILMRMRVLLLIRGVVLLSPAALLSYMAPIVLVVHMVMANLGVVARQPGVDAWDLPELAAPAGR